MAQVRQIVCPHCAAINRVPAGKEARQARCGACHRALFDGHPAATDGAQFDKHRRANDIPVLVDVWAAWCGPCRSMAPMFEQAAAELEPDVRLVKLNADEEPRIASELGVAALPTMLLLRGGREVARISGAMSARQIVSWARSQLAAAA